MPKARGSPPQVWDSDLIREDRGEAPGMVDRFSGSPEPEFVDVPELEAPSSCSIPQCPSTDKCDIVHTAKGNCGRKAVN